jgi:hypothetical protein
MNEIAHFKIFVLYNDDVAADMEYLHVKRIHLVSFSYIVIEDESRNISKKINNQILYCFQPFKKPGLQSATSQQDTIFLRLMAPGDQRLEAQERFEFFHYPGGLGDSDASK